MIQYKMTNDLAYITAPMNRSGTNFIAKIIQKSSDFNLPREIDEDYILENTDLFEHYFDETRWNEKLRKSPEFKDQFLSYIGDSISYFLKDKKLEDNKRLLLKTPNPYKINNFYRLFPNGKLLIIVRDGRDVVESASKTFTYASSEHWMRKWRKGAQRVLDFMREHKDLENKNWIMVRYEKLVMCEEEEISKICNFLNINIEKETIKNLPLYGSSENNDEDFWTPKEKPEGFNPLKKWNHWSQEKLNKFKHIAGKELKELGYED